MKKVFIIQGFEGEPNSGWKPWLMVELAKDDIYACSLAMPRPEAPIVSEWVEEINRQVEFNPNDDIYLVGHSLGVPAIFKYLESKNAKKIKGAVLVSGPVEAEAHEPIVQFLEGGFDFEKIKSKSDKFVVIHGDNDPLVPLSEAETISEKLDCELVIIENGKHLNGSAGWNELPQCLEVLKKIM